MPTKPGRSETDTTHPPARPKAQPRPHKRGPGDPLVPRDTRPGKPEQKEPPVENL